MKIKIDGKEILNLSEIQEKIIRNEIPPEIFYEDMTKRCKYWLELPSNKYAHVNKKSFISNLKEKGATTIPTNSLKLAETHGDIFPCKYGYKDITKDISCVVGDDSFSFSISHRKVFRKMKEADQEGRSRKDYLSHEKEELEKRLAWILPFKCERCLERLKLGWLPKLEERGIREIPIDDTLFAELVFSQSDYVESYNLN